MHKLAGSLDSGFTAQVGWHKCLFIPAPQEGQEFFSYPTCWQSVLAATKHWLGSQELSLSNTRWQMDILVSEHFSYFNILTHNFSRNIAMSWPWSLTVLSILCSNCCCLSQYKPKQIPISTKLTLSLKLRKLTTSLEHHKGMQGGKWLHWRSGCCIFPLNSEAKTSTLNVTESSVWQGICPLEKIWDLKRWSQIFDVSSPYMHLLTRC